MAAVVAIEGEEWSTECNKDDRRLKRARDDRRLKGERDDRRLKRGREKK